MDLHAPPLPPLRRLTKRRQFLACAKGRSLSRGAVVVQALARGGDDRAIGIGFTATKRVGGAVVRNRAKRRLREAARLLAPLHAQAGHDYVVIARMGAAERAWPRLLDDMRSALIGLAAGGDEPARVRSARPKTARPKPGGRPTAPVPSR